MKLYIKAKYINNKKYGIGEELEFDPNKIRNVRIKPGCGCTLFDYEGVEYKPSISSAKLKNLINDKVTL